MKKRTKLADRKLPNYTKGEEIFNMVTHIVGGAFGIVLLILCIVRGATHSGATGVLTGIVFGICMIVLYTMSAVYHGLSPRVKGKKVMQILDHCSVFLLIADRRERHSKRSPGLLLGWKVAARQAWGVSGTKK